MAFMPRALARKNKQTATAATTSAASKAVSSSSTQVTPKTTTTMSTSSDTTQPVASTSGTSQHASTSQTTLQDATRQLSSVSLVDEANLHRREQLLATIESSFSDWGLSVHSSSGLLDKLRDTSDGFVHIQQVLRLAPVAALTSNQVDVQHALAQRPSSVVKASFLAPTGFHIGRVDEVDFENLDKLEPAYWDDMTLYLEEIPSVPSTFGHSLVTYLSTLLSTKIQRVILPHMYDPQRSHEFEQSLEQGGQDEAFARAQAESGGQRYRRPGLKLPVGGGPLRGFAFIVVENKRDADRILNEWAWKKVSDVGAQAMETNRDQPEVEGSGDVSMSEDRTVDIQRQARVHGMRALSYKRWLELKSEYLKYRQSLNTLADAYAEQAHNKKRRRMRGSPSPQPTAHQTAAREHGTATERQDEASASKTPKRPAETVENGSNTKRSAKRIKRASSPSDWQRQVRAPTPEVALDSPQALDAKGAFPKGCIMWLRNVHEKSTKNSLKTVLGKLLEELEEGSGTGVEFIDYEKGLDNCHIRFASAHLAKLIFDHFNDNECFQLASNYISSPALSSTPPEGIDVEAQRSDRQRLVGQILEGERERIYWQQLPESTRRGARKNAGGPVALIEKGKKELARDLIEARLNEKTVGEQGMEQTLSEVDGQSEQQPKRTKKPSRA
ncbi:hypothetical protein OIO90_003688 [Microbotryomycetes sp. JL221]|nr:hypothetical protein OIO90_003688 [Microbotryomycetes sp. JL221]